MMFVVLAHGVFQPLWPVGKDVWVARGIVPFVLVLQDVWYIDFLFRSKRTV